MAKLPHKSGMSPADLARQVLRSHHAFGGMAGRQHFEGGGGDSSATTTPTNTTPATPSDQQYLDALNAAFQANFGRSYNPSTDSYWMDQLKAGKETLSNLQTDVASGAQGADQIRAQYLPQIQNLYQQDFGRAYNPATDSYWLNQLASGKEDPANLAKDIIAGAQGRDKLYYNTYNTPQQTQVVQPVQQPFSGYVGIPSGRTDVTPAPAATATQAQATTPASTSATAPAPAAGSGTYAGPGTTPFAPQQSLAQNYAGTPWNINAVQNYMSPNPLLGYQFNAPNLISAPLQTQYLANSGGPGVNSPTSTNVVNPTAAPATSSQPAYTSPAPDMSAYNAAYNAVMTNPTYVGTSTTPSTTTTTTPTTTVTKPATSTTTTTPTFANDTAALTATTNPTTAQAGADYLATQAAKSTGLPASDFTASNTSPNYVPVNIPVSSYTYTPQDQLPSQSEGYLANLASVRANPVEENALQGAAAAGIPGFGVKKRGGSVGSKNKNKPRTGAFVKKALMIVSTYRPKRSKQAG